MALSFNGTTACLFRSSFSPATAYPCTVALWFYPQNNSVNQALVNWGGDVPGNNNVGVGLDGTAAGDPMYAYLKAAGTSATNAVTTTGVTLNTWMHVAAVFASATDRRCYLNGGSAGSSVNSVGFPATPTTFTLGSYHNNSVPSTFFAGRLGEAAVWSAALTTGEIASLAAGCSPPQVRPAALVDYWPLLGGAAGGPEIDPVRRQELTWSGSPTQAAHAPVLRKKRNPAATPAPVAAFRPAWARGANVLVGPQGAVSC